MQAQYIADLKAKCNIAEVIQDYIKLRKKGRDYEACCPFHDEATPSFSVSTSKNIYHCFGCGKTGDSIDFVQSYTGRTFPDAVAVLAEKYRMPAPERNDTPAEKEARHLRDEASAALETAQAYYRAQSAPAVEYLRGRGFSDAVIDRFEVGFAPAGNCSFVNVTDTVGGDIPQVTESAMLAAGIVGSSEDNGKTRSYERFTDRVMFPIRSTSGKLVAFGGRLRASGKIKNKYINSPETVLYRKSQTLYGLHLAQKAITAAGTANVVEGYTDVMRLHERGAENTVGGCGTSLTADQFALLKRYAHTAILILDGDASGQKAMIRSVLVALTAGLGVKIVTLTDGNDPDSWAAKSATIADTIPAMAQHWVDVYADIYAAMTEPVQRAEFVRTVAQCLQATKSIELRHEYSKRAEELFGISFMQDNKAQFLEPEKKVTGKKTSPTPGRAQDENELLSPIEDSKQSDHHYGYYKLWRNGSCYYTMKKHKDGDYEIKLSNFVMQFVYHFDDGSLNTRRLVKIQLDNGSISLFELEDNCTTLNKLRPILMSKSAVWHGGQEELDNLYSWLLSECSIATTITRIGWLKKEQMYALSDALIVDGKVHRADLCGIVTVGEAKYYLPAWSQYTNPDDFETERRSCYRPGTHNFASWAKLVYEAYGVNGAIGILFLINCIHRDIVYEKLGFFPYLFLYGQAGSGKSSYAEMLLRIWGGKDPGTSSGSNFKAIARTASQRTNALMYLKEYDNTSITPEMERFFKNSYDGNGYSIAQRTGDSKTKSFLTHSGMLIDGNSLPTKTLPMYDRMIITSFDTAKFSNESSEAHKKLKETINDGFSNVLVELLKTRDVYNEKHSEAFDFMLARHKGWRAEYNGEVLEGDIWFNGFNLSTLPDRTQQHLAFLSSAYLTLEKTLKFPFTHQEVLAQIRSDAIEKNAMMAQNNPREVFWTALDYTANNEKYRVMEGKQWVRDVFDNKVFIKMAELYPCYVKFCKESGNQVEDQYTLIKHLTNHESFVKSTQKGDSQSMNKAGFGRCFAFKYDTPGGNVITIGGKQVSFMNE